MHPISRTAAISDGSLTRFFLMLIAVGTSLMLLSGAMLPTDAEGAPAAWEGLRLCVERVMALLG